MAGSANLCLHRSMELRWATASRAKKIPKRPTGADFSIPVYLTTNPSHVNPALLRHLFISCNRSCHAFPRVDASGRNQIDDRDIASVEKLRIALNHSAVVVSVFCEPRDLPFSGSEDGIEWNMEARFCNFLRRMVPAVSPYNGQLVGFGRAVSDAGLTASIHDVMVIPQLQRMGIGRMIVQRIVRILTGKDIYDIAALCSDDDSLFFEACGFGDDILRSTTMMYTRAVTGSYPGGNEVTKRAGRKLLLVPTCKRFDPTSKNWKTISGE
ncbi:hypothetical protein SAY86_018513 [Trapa natans]|uniref:N-acetyltransferase domain-containing protein n=1 Tax=Trapa natans TaxID=22666 RepID=A0AAN7R0Z3_TRANT|nr:hypothetical protein SAY86_018513 [Trapa natans]